MSKTVRIPVFLSDDSNGKKVLRPLSDSIRYPEKCVYCGAPKTSDSSKTMKFSVKKAGEKEYTTYSYQTNIPYCKEHAEQLKKFGRYGCFLVGAGMIFTLGFMYPVASFYWKVALGFFHSITGEDWISFVMGGFILLLVAAVPGLLAAVTLKKVLGIFNPPFKDYSLDYGLGLSVKLSEPKEDADLPTHTLDFTFSNEDFATAFLERNLLSSEEIAVSRQELSTTKADRLLVDDNIRRFYENTIHAWRDGKLSDIDPSYAKEAESTHEEFLEKYRPVENGALHIFFDQFPPRPDEYLVGVSGWFVLTNLRLVQRDGLSATFKEIQLKHLDSYRIKGRLVKTLRFKMKSGETIIFRQVQMYPKESILNMIMKQATNT